MKPAALLVLAAFLLPAQAQTLEQRAHAFVAAFNARDLDAQLALAHDEIEWLSAEQGQLKPQTRGKPALREAMAGYAKSCPSCRSELKQCLASELRLACVEVARWTGKSGPRAQQSLSVYEFEGGLIRRVSYWPSEAVAP
jgi:hypothetical protein